MNKNNDKKNLSIKNNPEDKKPWIIIITLVVLSIFVFGLYFYFINNYTNMDIPKNNIRSLESEIIRLESLVDENKKNNQTLFEQQIQYSNLIALLSKKIDSNLNTAQMQPEQTQKLWLLAEIKYLLNLANTQYLLSYNIDLALLAYELALEKIKSSNLPDLLNIENSIKKELNILNDFNAYNPDNLLKFFEEIMEKSKFFPFSEDAKDNTELPKNDSSWPTKIMQSIKDSMQKIIIVRNTSKINHNEIYQPSNKIISARLLTSFMDIKVALITNNQKNYQRLLKNTINWIERFYDQEASIVKDILNDLNKKYEYKIVDQKPDISATLLLINEYEDMLNKNKFDTGNSNK